MPYNKMRMISVIFNSFLPSFSKFLQQCNQQEQKQEELYDLLMMVQQLHFDWFPNRLLGNSLRIFNIHTDNCYLVISDAILTVCWVFKLILMAPHGIRINTA